VSLNDSGYPCGAELEHRRLRVLIMKGRSQYGGTRLFCDEAAGAFQRRGWDIEILDLGAADEPNQVFADYARTAGGFRSLRADN